MDTELVLILACGVVALLYGGWAVDPSCRRARGMHVCRKSPPRFRKAHALI